MKRLLLISVLSFLALVQTAMAQQYRCTKWYKQRNLNCVYAGRTADVWERQCENPCRRPVYGPQCDVDRLCIDSDPNVIQGPCTEWRREQGVSCHNPASGRWEQKWTRACLIGLSTTWCSNEDPNF